MPLNHTVSSDARNCAADMKKKKDYEIILD
jgi:hypothetical protein